MPTIHPSWFREPVFTQEQYDAEDDQEYWDYTPYWLTIKTDDTEEPDFTIIGDTDTELLYI